MPHNLTVLRVHKFHVQVEGTADPVVRDHWGEDLRAVHLSCNLVAWKIPWGRFPQIWTVRHCVITSTMVLRRENLNTFQKSHTDKNFIQNYFFTR